VQRIRRNILQHVGDILDQPDGLLLVLEEGLELGAYQLWRITSAGIET
jgi:glucose/arabinose dehydrogenase